MRVSYRGLAASSAMVWPLQRSRLSVTSLSSIKATTMSPFSAVRALDHDQIAFLNAGLDH